MAQSDRPLSKYALADALNNDPEAICLVLDMLKATVRYQGHEAGFSVDIVWDGNHRVGYSYFLGSSGGPSDPSFENYRRLPREIVPALRALEFIAPSKYPNITGGFWQFTDKALAWYEQFGGPSDETVQRAIGRAIRDAGPGGLPLADLDTVATDLEVDRARVDEQLRDLIRLNLVAQRDGPPTLDLDTVAGPIWSLRQFGPLSDLPPDVFRPPSEVPLAEVPSLVRSRASLAQAAGGDGPYDVFLSYASEDDKDVAEPLAAALTEAGLRVWFAPITLKIGDSQRREIDRGIANSRVAVVILSRDYLKKGWTNHELNGIVLKDVAGEQQLLPIWHNITKQEVIDFSPHSPISWHERLPIGRSSKLQTRS
jgi:hypothetical protein